MKETTTTQPADKIREFSLRCLVVDDEEPAHAILKNYIGQVSALEYIGSALNAIEATNILHREKIDLMFLDINMPRMTGLELLESMSRPPKVILTTAYSEFALQSYDLGVLDYLMKPISFPRFMKSINKLLDLALETYNTVEEPKPLVADSFWIKTDSGLHRIVFQDIMYLQSFGNYVRVALQNGTTHLTAHTTKELEAQLPVQSFARIHKSYIINIKSLTRVDGGRVYLGKTELPIGAMYRKEFLARVS